MLDNLSFNRIVQYLIQRPLKAVFTFTPGGVSCDTSRVCFRLSLCCIPAGHAICLNVLEAGILPPPFML